MTGRVGTVRIVPWVAAMGMVLLALSPARVEAQEAITRVQGTVTDVQGNPLAKVPLYFQATDIKKRVGPVKTSKKGKFTISALDISIAKKWTIEAQKSGYKVVKVVYEIIDHSRNERGKGENLVGSNQKMPEMEFALIGTVGRNVVDIVMAKDSEYMEALRAEKQKQQDEGAGEVAKAGTPGASEAETPKPAPPSGGRKLLQTAKQYTDAGRHEEAIALYREYLVKDPSGNPAAYYYLGKSLFESEDDISAELAFKKGLELKPDMKGASFYLGNVYLRLERFSEAIASFEKERDLSPDSDSVHYNLGMAYAESGQEDLAMASFEQAALLNPDKPEAFMQMAAIHEERAEAAGTDGVTRQEEMTKAEEMYQKVVGVDPRNAAISFYNIGARAWNQNRNKEAAQAFRKSIEIDSTYAEAHRELARALMGIQDFEGAVKHFEEYLRLKPGAADAREIRNNIALLRG
jgi:tetratricopeptide (TPR) repeat protein